jgi:stage V sporulation protein S
MSIIKVSANSRVSAVGGAIAGIIRERQRAEVHATGEEAVNRALKAVDLAMANFKLEGIPTHCVLEFADVLFDEGMRPAIRLIVVCQSTRDLPIESGELAAEDFDLT